MTGRFRTRTAPRYPRWLLVLFIGVLSITMFTLYRVIIPFQSMNPFWHEVTVGEPVIDRWDYGGRDEEGYLRFYNQGQTIVLPPSAHMFDADGKFVVIEKFTSSSLTYADPFEALPLSWLFALVSVVLVLSGFIVFKRKKTKNMFHAQRGTRRTTVRHQPASNGTRGRVTRKKFRAFGRSKFDP